MSNYTKTLYEVNKDSLMEAGGKGSNLGELIRAGLPVPPGFIVTTSAYRAHIRENGLQERISERLEKLNVQDISAIADASKDISSWIEDKQMPILVREEVFRALESLSKEMGTEKKLFVAVRSSATAEDLSSASFAGQHDTFLGICGKESVLEHVKKCWISLWTPQAIIYRINMGFEHLKVDLAVVVQAMIDSEVAGVMFTANPVNGNHGEILISAGYGLGEAVVSGLITPDTFIMTKNGHLKEKILGSKDKKIVLTEGGTRIEKVTQVMQDQYCLGKRELEKLVDLAQLVEKHYGEPQDTEWACSNGKIYILQARPITNIKFEREDLNVLNTQDKNIARKKKASFIQKMAMERFSEPMAPLDFACLEQRIKGFQIYFNKMGLKMPPIRVIEKENGYVTIDFGKMSISPAVLLKFPFILIKNLLKGAPKDVEVLWKSLSVEMNLWLKKMEVEVCKANSAEELAKLIKQAMDDFGKFFQKRSGIIGGPTSGDDCKLDRLIKKAVGVENSADIKEKLLKALPFRTALQNMALAKLAQTAAVKKTDIAFEAEFSSFLEEYGDRPTSGTTAMLSIPTWRERPEIVHEIVNVMLKDNAVFSLEKDFEKQKIDYHEAKKTIKKKLKKKDYDKFEQVLETFRKGIILREESSFMLEKVTAAIRRMALKLGGILSKNQIIEDKEDVFYIFINELSPVAEGKLFIKEKIKKRKQAFTEVYAAHKKGVHWMISTGSVPGFKTNKKDSTNKPNDINILKGLPASSGLYEGTVCVVRDPSEFNKLKNGDIMVSPYTSPVWTPLFKLAGALVTEIGSPASHAAIVAREYGIPAVVAIENATNKLKDGQKIRVDGTNGIVTLMSS